MKKRIEKTRDKIVAVFKQGLSPKLLSQSIAVSTALSVIPILGVTTFILTVLSVKRKLNLPIMMGISYLMWPVQILLIIPFIRVGEFIFSIPSKPHSVEEIVSSFQNSFFETLSVLSFELLCGLGAWFVTVVPFTTGIYLLFLLFLKKVSVKN